MLKQAHISLGEGLEVIGALLPGDPARVERVFPFLSDVKELAWNREYRSASGYYRGHKLLVLSTGIGGASMGIAVEELAKISVNKLVRIGSCGALQTRVKLGDLLVVLAAVRDDGASASYLSPAYPAVADVDLLRYALQAAEKLPTPCHCGLVRSHDSFYTDKEEEISNYWSKYGVLGADMETASLFTIGRLRGVKTLSILNNVVLWQGDTAQAIENYVAGEEATRRGEEHEIIVALETLRLAAES